MKELWLLLWNSYIENSPQNDWNGLKEQKAIVDCYKTFSTWNSEESDLHTNIKEQILISVTELLWTPCSSRSCTLSSWYLQVRLLHYVQQGLTELKQNHASLILSCWLRLFTQFVIPGCKLGQNLNPGFSWGFHFQVTPPAPPNLFQHTSILLKPLFLYWLILPWILTISLITGRNYPLTFSKVLHSPCSELHSHFWYPQQQITCWDVLKPPCTTLSHCYSNCPRAIEYPSPVLPLILILKYFRKSVLQLQLTTCIFTLNRNW